MCIDIFEINFIASIDSLFEIVNCCVIASTTEYTFGINNTGY